MLRVCLVIVLNERSNGYKMKWNENNSVYDTHTYTRATIKYYTQEVDKNVGYGSVSFFIEFT